MFTKQKLLMSSSFHIQEFQLNTASTCKIHMTSCDYDGVFYRVFCVTLLAIALTFTIILTNVFVDIDGLLTNKRGVTHKNLDPTDTLKDDVDITFTPQIYANEENENNYEDIYRSKRSLETKNFLFHIKNPQMKSILTNRLATLLDELDAGNPNINKNRNETEISIEKNKDDKRNTREDKEITGDNKDDLLHSDLHKVLLLGLIGHMDFNEVYNRVHTIFSKNYKSKDDATWQTSEERGNIKSTLSTDEQQIFNEIMNCKELRNQVIDGTKKMKENSRRKNIAPKGPKVIIKTLIDITSLSASQHNKPEINSNENVKALIKLIYNGRSIKFSHIDDEETTTVPVNIENTNKIPIDKRDKYYKTETMDKVEYSKDINKFIQEYIKHNKNYEETSEVKQETKRIKRNIKIRYDNENNKVEDVSQKFKIPTKKDDDELFVEIETHFDSKGTKGEKKKKLIRNLIEKIQKAIHSIPEGNKNKVTHLHIKKRTQNPLNQKNKGRLINKISLPYDAVVHRHVDPIGKLIPIHESLTYMMDKSSKTLKNKYGPKFLAVSKAINSAEMSEVDVDYNKVMLLNGIPERIQKPLNIVNSGETQNYNTYNDMGKLKFLVKDIDGSGFSVGFNQYVDAPPDKEAMNLFTGLENIIQTYHQTYDQTEAPGETEKVELSKEKYEELDNDPIEHVVLRRSVDNSFGDDHHSNEYKIIFNSNFLPYQNYEEIFNSKLNKIKDTDTTKFIKNEEDKLTKKTLVVDEDIFNKNLKPSEIFGLANLIHRKKRSVSVNKISSLKNKIKLHRYLNTKAMANKRIFLNKKRNKRQVNKIRIIATDNMPNLRRHSEEDIFVVSDENLLADRAVVREVEMPEIGKEKIMEDHYDIISPYIYEEPADQTFVTNTFGGRSRHNALMSKYPHIFMDEISRSKEEEISPDIPLVFNKYVDHYPTSTIAEPTTQLTATNIPLPKVEEIVNAIAPQNGKTNYKLTVKIMPKNSTDMNPGFKEVHTSINKSYNKNGLFYSSLVNVSEISKIVKINKTDNLIKPGPSTQSPIISQMMRQREKMNSLLKQHKDRIEEQLKHLNKEKEKLDSMALTTEPELEAVTRDQYIDVVLPFDPPKLLRLTKEEVNKLAVASLLQSYENPVVDSPLTTTITSTTTLPSTTTTTFPTTHTTTTKPLTTTTPRTTTTTTTDPSKQIERQLIEQKTKMIKNIEKNGNLTNEILNKIDRNTEILQAFLRKLTENINLIIPKPEEEAKKPTKYDIHDLKQTINHLPEPFNQVMPHIEANNDTHVTIPFVYAYQQPYPIPNKPENPVASVVYHGHIHTNTINNRKTEGWHTKEHKNNIKEHNLKNVLRRDINQTRFFIDELENDFKAIPAGVDKKNNYIKVFNNTNVR